MNIFFEDKHLWLSLLSQNCWADVFSKSSQSSRPIRSITFGKIRYTEKQKYEGRKKIKYESVLNLQLIWKRNPLLFYRYFSGVDGRVERQLVESDCGSFGAVSEKHFQRLQKCRPRCKQYIFPLFYCNYKWYTGASNMFRKCFSLHILLLFFPHTWSYEE